MRLKYLYKEARAIAFRHLSLRLAIFLIPFACYFPYLTACHSRRKRVARAKFNSGTPGTSARLRLSQRFIMTPNQRAAPCIRIASFGIVADTACNITVKYRPIHRALYNITFHRNYDGILPNDRTRCSCSLFAPVQGTEIRLGQLYERVPREGAGIKRSCI